jgi:nickel-dependent lactate racemase
MKSDTGQRDNMKIILENEKRALTNDAINEVLDQTVNANANKKRVLLIPPDSTRSLSGAGYITPYLYNAFTKLGAQVKVMPALGTHMQMTEAELHAFFGKSIPIDAYLTHDYKNGVTKIGEVPGEYIGEISEGLISDKIDVEVNECIVDGSFDAIFSIGQVVPHEVVGMANYSKNIFVGCGGEKMIGATHMLGAVYGMERIMGQDFSPVRKVFDYAEQNFIADIPLTYILTVCTADGDTPLINGLYIGRDRSLFEKGVALSQKLNLTYVDRAPKKVVVYLDPHEFKTTWVGNKSIYRTRMAIADGGELIVIAPGVRQCGESPEPDRLIKKFGYVGRIKVLELFNENKELHDNPSISAHLIHGSSDGRFKITYCPGGMDRELVESIGFNYMDVDAAKEKYNYESLKDGWNDVNGEEIFFISNPAIGLWVDETRIKK